MFSTIVVGVDGREADRDALALARRLAAPGATLLLTAVADTGGGAAASRLASADYDRVVRESLEDTVARVHRTLERPDGGEVRTEVIVAASVASGLVAVAERNAADLIVIGSCQHGAMRRIFAGDDARSTIHASRTPVAVAPKDYADADHPLAAIGVGYDGDAQARAAFRLGKELAGDRLQLRVLRVVNAAHHSRDPSGMGAAVAIEFDDQEAHAEIAALGAEAVIDGRIEIGLPNAELGDFERTVDLLVVGSHQRSLFRRLFAGSTSEALSRNLHCPLLVVPPDGTGGEATPVGAGAARGGA